VATIEATLPLEISPGKYSLYYETDGMDADYWICFTFVSDGGRDAAILIQDDGLSPVEPLLMHADPA
jgi:hypothetical protein